jgi:hypothetical protein
MSAVAARLNALIGSDCTYINNEYHYCPHRHFRFQKVNKDGTTVNICYVDMPHVIDTHTTNVVKFFASHQNAVLLVPKGKDNPHVNGLSLALYNPTTDGDTGIPGLLYEETDLKIFKLMCNDRKIHAVSGAQNAISRINAICSLCPLSVEVLYTHPIADVIKADKRISVFIKNTRSESYIPIFVAFALALMFKA